MVSSYKKYYLTLIAIFLGFIITIQLKSNLTFQGVVTIPEMIDMQRQIDNINIENENTKKSKEELLSKLSDYQTSLENTGSVVKSMKEELKSVRAYEGVESVEGPGIIITLNDSLEVATDNENLQLGLIHDLDVLEIINELKSAGAEAISINDERLIANSNIRCGGPTINIDGKRHATPFIIKAIGDPKTLEATALAENNYIDLMVYSGIRAEVRKVERLTMNPYSGSSKLNYQKKAKGGETK